MSEIFEEKQGMEEDTQQGRFLTFTLEDEVYGIEIRYVTEIIGIQSITEVPELPDFIRGIINLRGKIIPVMDVRVRFRKQQIPYNDRTCIIVIDISDVSIGLIVDTVAEVMNIAEENVVPPPDSRTGFSNRYVKGIGKVEGEVKLILDCERLLRDEELDQLTQLS